jgi:hypothetical protein
MMSPPLRAALGPHPRTVARSASHA